LRQTLFLIICLALLSNKVSATPSLKEGVFTKQQAKSGKRLYKNYCASCHEGNYFSSVLLAWRGETLVGLYDIIINEMPENDPGALERKQYTAILAYILSSSKYPVGKTPLDPQSLEFSQLIIE